MEIVRKQSVEKNPDGSICRPGFLFGLKMGAKKARSGNIASPGGKNRVKSHGSVIDGSTKA